MSQNTVIWASIQPTMEILKVEEAGVEAAARAAAAVINSGGIVVYPTDTLYGIGVNALSIESLERLRALKGREAQKPVSIIVRSVDAIETYGALSPEARDIAEKFLPGALTLVLPATASVPKELAVNGTIGIRVPNDPFTLALAAASTVPVTSTSANLAGKDTPHTIEDIISHFGDAAHSVDLYIDAGPRSGGVASTVIAFTDSAPHVLREGVISKEELGL